MGRFHFMLCSELGVLRRGAGEENSPWMESWLEARGGEAGCLDAPRGLAEDKAQAASRCAGWRRADGLPQKRARRNPDPSMPASTIKPLSE